MLCLVAASVCTATQPQPLFTYRNKLCEDRFRQTRVCMTSSASTTVAKCNASPRMRARKEQITIQFLQSSTTAAASDYRFCSQKQGDKEQNDGVTESSPQPPGGPCTLSRTPPHRSASARRPAARRRPGPTAPPAPLPLLPPLPAAPPAAPPCPACGAVTKRDMTVSETEHRRVESISGDLLLPAALRTAPRPALPVIQQ